MKIYYYIQYMVARIQLLKKATRWLLQEVQKPLEVTMIGHHHTQTTLGGRGSSVCGRVSSSRAWELGELRVVDALKLWAGEVAND